MFFNHNIVISIQQTSSQYVIANLVYFIQISLVYALLCSCMRILGPRRLVIWDGLFWAGINEQSRWKFVP